MIEKQMAEGRSAQNEVKQSSAILILWKQIFKVHICKMQVKFLTGIFHQSTLAQLYKTTQKQLVKVRYFHEISINQSIND